MLFNSYVFIFSFLPLTLIIFFGLTKFGLIKIAIPEAKIIHVHRNPKAVCWSNFKQNFRKN